WVLLELLVLSDAFLSSWLYLAVTTPTLILVREGIGATPASAISLSSLRSRQKYLPQYCGRKAEMWLSSNQSVTIPVSEWRAS
ncbi:unnamed protein product, partial [Ceratitis capitata]